jgi:hypothetical protein
MDDTTHGGAQGRKHAEVMYALKNPVDGEREVYAPLRKEPSSD